MPGEADPEHTLPVAPGRPPREQLRHPVDQVPGALRPSLQLPQLRHQGDRRRVLLSQGREQHGRQVLPSLCRGSFQRWWAPLMMIWGGDSGDDDDCFHVCLVDGDQTRPSSDVQVSPSGDDDDDLGVWWWWRVWGKWDC